MKNHRQLVISSAAKRNREILHPKKLVTKEDLFAFGECFRFAQVSTALHYIPLRSK